MFRKNVNKMISLLSLLGIVMGVSAFLPAAPVYAAGFEDTQIRGGPGGNGMGNGNGTGTGSGFALTPLTEAEEEGLQSAILEEYKAYNLYLGVMDQLGEIYPFDQISTSEKQHFTALIRQAEKYGVEVPANPGLNPMPEFGTVSAACTAGVNAELEDADLYDTLLAVTAHTDLQRVYTNLQRASLENHLIEFQTCD